MAYSFRVVNSGLVQTVADHRLPNTKVHSVFTIITKSLFVELVVMKKWTRLLEHKVVSSFPKKITDPVKIFYLWISREEKIYFCNLDPGYFSWPGNGSGLYWGSDLGPVSFPRGSGPDPVHSTTGFETLVSGILIFACSNKYWYQEEFVINNVKGY